MPLFEFACTKCDFRFEVLMRRDDPFPPCTMCGAPTRKLVSAHGGIVMKEGGGHVHTGSCCGQSRQCDSPKRCCEH
ncbi:MAG TPA: zinc ribbon domain-containing protein [bacterium]|nr:zinc ribbon domain-containing protein [bacterium]